MILAGAERTYDGGFGVMNQDEPAAGITQTCTEFSNWLAEKSRYSPGAAAHLAISTRSVSMCWGGIHKPDVSTLDDHPTEGCLAESFCTRVNALNGFVRRIWIYRDTAGQWS